MNIKKLFGWLTLDIVIFIGINIFLVSRYIDELGALAGLNIFQFIILALATYRMANIISNEVVMKPLRAPFVDEKMEDGKLVEKPKKTGFLGAIGLLIYCPSCTGVWVAAILVYLWVFWPTSTSVVATIFALSAIERIVASIVGRLKTDSE